ncbi:MAG: ADP-ribosylglycohydrolase family protein, partial [Deltaproteobacteria bacterium]|nr:ADP-ribosylglycohydrolase family protein [Deltaproteobacteria bacterium]
MKQISLFNELNKGDNELLEKFKASLILSAVGDSLGWPLEFKKQKPKRKVESFIKWKKSVGGKWWGYEDEISPGEYSDDTQLTLSVARSIRSNGEFDPNYFAYLELPLWLNYERGGGKSIKSAARNLIKRKTLWFNNFYRTKEVRYFNAGANGAAMRNLPIALVNMDNEKRFIVDTIKNSLITHGHPRGIIGSLLMGAAQMYLLKEEPSYKIFDYIEHLLNKS